ncbi:hypothetical protein E2C01_004895 [Portunus trituberculatus]|uniref:Uncharacterized protein n=1 Tax=Portunus trituberculatus TaxID=210409 RepID=A0A5B7CV56_PORTR|nr:hypothetical protein [Portunus trituberculatus]
MFGAPLCLTSRSHPTTLSLSLSSPTHLKGDLPRFFLSLVSAAASSPPSVVASVVRVGKLVLALWQQLWLAADRAALPQP